MRPSSRRPFRNASASPEREPQIVGAQLEQVTVRAQRSQRKVRLGPGGEHELEGGRCMIDEPGDALAGRAGRKPVEVIQDQRDLTQIVQLIHQARQHHWKRSTPPRPAAVMPAG